jgi:Putative transposase
LKLNPHVHAVFLDGVYREKEDELELEGLAHLTTREVATVLERTRDRIKKYLGRQGLLQEGDAPEDASGFSDEDGLAMLAASAVSCATRRPRGRTRRGGPRGAPEVHPASSSTHVPTPHTSAMPRR